MRILLLHAAYIYAAVAADIPFIIAFVRGVASAAMQLPRFLVRHIKNKPPLKPASLGGLFFF